MEASDGWGDSVGEKGPDENEGEGQDETKLVCNCFLVAGIEALGAVTSVQEEGFVLLNLAKLVA